MPCRYVVTADNKWFTRVVMAAEVVDARASTNLHHPKASEEKFKKLDGIKKQLTENRW